MKCEIFPAAASNKTHGFSWLKNTLLGFLVAAWANFEVATLWTYSWQEKLLVSAETKRLNCEQPVAGGHKIK